MSSSFQERVLAGSDRPIVDDGPIAEPPANAMETARLMTDEQQAIASGDCLRLLGLAGVPG
jgi:hypothetical protein